MVATFVLLSFVVWVVAVVPLGRSVVVLMVQMLLPVVQSNIPVARAPRFTSLLRLDSALSVKKWAPDNVVTVDVTVDTAASV